MSGRSGRAWFVVFLVTAFAFRLCYGLSMPFWFEDERQVYLIGLRSFARGEWPYFGADVVWTGGQLPGALQGMLIRWPLSAWPAPEAPIVLLNLISFSALAFFAWYLCRRLPDVPRWLVWGALFTLPWTLNFSTHITNVSYILPGAILFFVGFFEGTPGLSRRILPFALAWALMGAGLLFVLQEHMSWVLLPPYGAVAMGGLVFGKAGRLPGRRGRLVAIAGASFLAGAAAIGWLLVPTVLRYGADAGGATGALQFAPRSPVQLLKTAARTLSFASYETNRFFGVSTAERLLALARMPWLVPAVAVVAAAGIWQPLWMAVSLFRRGRTDREDWTRVRILLAATVALVYVDYFFSVREPQAHAFYVVFPVAVLFAATCWQLWARENPSRWKRWDRVAAVVLVCGVLAHAGLAWDRWSQDSLYANRAVAAAAIDQRNDRLMGDRRDRMMEKEDYRPRPQDRVADADAFLSAKFNRDLQLGAVRWRRGLLGVSIFDVTIANRSEIAAWLDVQYETTYFGAQGQILATRGGVFKQILEPGDTRSWADHPDGFVPDGTTTATIGIMGAQRTIPVPRR
ncbi:MAG TPA: hypothetical protein VFV78_14020 [Vicinamibacterales bacterium]|nr:hypothetical protein [Vicinamibacterales bacterium]